MELRSRKSVPTGVRDESTSSDTRGTSSSTDTASEKGSGGDEKAEVPAYERERQERIRRNSEKLAELGIHILAEALKTPTDPTNAAAGEGNRRRLKAKQDPGTNTLENCQKRRGYLNPKP